MKKFFSILAVCAVVAIAACNNATENKTEGNDTTKVIAPADTMKTMPADTTMKSDTTKKM